MAKQADDRRKIWGSSLTRKTPLRQSGFVKRPREPRSKTKPEKRARPSLNKGKKVKEWDAVRAKLKPLYEAAGITSCELKLSGCWRDYGLGFAHAKKRRNLKHGEIEIVILACSANCHNFIEALPEREMEEIVLSVIDMRPVKIPSIF